MAVYVIVLVAVVLLLVAAYRALGGAAVRPVDSGPLLRSLHAELLGSLDGLATSLRATDAAAAAPAADVRDGRRLSAAVQQTLDRLPPEVELDEVDAAARVLLAAAAEDAAWAWRMVGADGTSAGLASAVTALCAHATECCKQAQALFAAAARAEPGDSS